MNTKLSEFQKIIGFDFNNAELLNIALTHSSYANENKSRKNTNNERLEFLGDSILSLIVSNHIFTNYEELPEGEMTKIRAGVVCEQALKEVADQLEIGRFIKLGKGEELTGGRKRSSLLSDAFEAIVGAIYLDKGYDQAETFVLKNLLNLIVGCAKARGILDYKTRLQEVLQKKGEAKITYEVISESGPDHEKEFSVQVKCNDKILGLAKGKSKKEAEQVAASIALSIVDGG